MKTRRNTLLLVFALFAFPLAASDFSGKWEGTYSLTGPDGHPTKGSLTCTIEQTGDTFTGLAATDQLELKITGGKVDGDKIHFELTADSVKAIFDLALEDGHLRGSGGGDTDNGKIAVKLDLARPAPKP